MADNITATPGTGATLGADLISGVLYVRNKIIVGADGTNDGDVCTANPMPVVLGAGSLILGKVTTDQTTHGTTDLVAADITKVAGVAISQGHGTASTAIRVELPTDGTGVVGLIAGTALVGKFGFDQTTPGTTNAVALAQVNAATCLAGNGVTGTGSQRVTIASDNTPFPVKVDQTTPGTTNAVALAQVNAATCLAGNGVTGTGSQRVTVASDNTPFPVKTDQTTHGTTDLVAADITKVAGASVATGHGTASGAVRVELPTDGTGVVGLAAGTALVGKVSASLETSTIYNGTTALTPKFAKIAAASNGDNTLVAAVSSKKIRVLAYNFVSNGTVNAKFQDGASGTDLTGLKYCVANMGICAPFNPAGWFETTATTLLNINLSAGVAIGGELVYVEV